MRFPYVFYKLFRTEFPVSFAAKVAADFWGKPLRENQKQTAREMRQLFLDIFSYLFVFRS